MTAIMEPGAYKTFNTFQGIPAPDLSQASQERNDEWTVDGADAFPKRNFSHPLYQTFMSANPEPWMSVTNQQPLMNIDLNDGPDDEM